MSEERMDNCFSNIVPFFQLFFFVGLKVSCQNRSLRMLYKKVWQELGKMKLSHTRRESKGGE